MHPNTIEEKYQEAHGHYRSQNYADSIRAIEKAMGCYEKSPVEAESAAHRYARRSIVTSRDIPGGTCITCDMLTFKRPGTGIYPKHVDDVVGRTAREAIPEDTVLIWEMLS